MADLARALYTETYQDYLNWHSTREDAIPDTYFPPPLPTTASLSTLHQEIEHIEDEVSDYRRRRAHIRAEIIHTLKLLECRATDLARELNANLPPQEAGIKIHELFFSELIRRRNTWDRRRSRRQFRARQLFLSIPAAPEVVSRVIQTPEIAMNILLFLPPAARVVIFRVCRAWRDLAWSQARLLFPRAVLSPGAPPPYVLARWSERRFLCLSCSLRLRTPRRFLCGTCNSIVRTTRKAE